MQALIAALLATLERTHDRVSPAFLAGALVIAVAVWARRARRSVRLARFLFDPALWWHRSARLDYAILVARVALDALWLGTLTLSVQAVTFATARWLWRAVGTAPEVDFATSVVIAVFSVGAFVVEDLARYAIHYAAHRIPAFWELHKVHHSAEVLTPATIYRVHPIEGLLNAAAAALAVGLFGGVISWLQPGKLGAWSIGGVYALQWIWNVAGTNLRHSHVWISYGPTIEHLLISPAQHQIHHSRDPRHHDRNFGSALAVWDWMFGTLHVTAGRERLRFGLDAAEWSHGHELGSALVRPVIECARVCGAPLRRIARVSRNTQSQTE